MASGYLLLLSLSALGVFFHALAALRAAGGEARGVELAGPARASVWWFLASVRFLARLIPAEWLVIYVLPILAPIVGIVFFVGALYDRLPQEFGGNRPRSAYVELAREDVSAETYRALASPQAGDPPRAAPAAGTDAKRASDAPKVIVRTRRLLVFFAEHNSLLVKPFRPGALAPFRADATRVYELRRDQVKGLVWCGRP